MDTTAPASSTVLVTGGAGYIGSHTVRALSEAGRDVVVLDTLENGSADNVIDATLVVGDSADAELVEQVCRDHGVSQVVHFAAYKAVGESMSNPGKYWRNNVSGTVEMIEGCVAAGVDNIVFSSSAGVYGDAETYPLTEATEARPQSVYAETKLMMERILAWYDETSGVRSVALRYFNASGASFDARIGEDLRHSQNLMPHVMRAVLEPGARLAVYGNDYETPDGTCVRDYIHVVDLAAAHVAALDYLAAGGATAVVNIGTGIGSSVLDVIAAVEQASGQTVPYDIVERRPGDPDVSYADPTRSRELLGWTARYGLDEIAATAYAWHASRYETSS